MTTKRVARNAQGAHSGLRAASNVRHVVLDDPADVEKGSQSTRCLGGSNSKALNNALANQAVRTVWVHRDATQSDCDQLCAATVAALMEFKPTDAIEGMMAVQAIGLHNASVECLRRAMLPDQPSEAADRLRRQAANLSRAFLDVVAGLDRKRGKGGHQVVRIERVQVAPGGQAVVGNVQTGIAGADTTPVQVIGQNAPGFTLNAQAFRHLKLANAGRLGEGA